jgi:uncharacterized protein with HEPN domain
MATSDGLRIRHTIESHQRAQNLISGRSQGELKTDDGLGLALTKLVEIVGEAAKGVSKATRDKYPEIPWRQMAGTRDRIVHDYSDVDLDIVWNIVTERLPAISEALDRVAQETPPN